MSDATDPIIRRMKRWQVILGTIMMVSAIIGPVTAVGWHQYENYRALEQQVAENTRSLLALRFFELDKKRRSYGLTPAEYNEFCELGRALEYFMVCPPAHSVDMRSE